MLSFSSAWFFFLSSPLFSTDSNENDRSWFCRPYTDSDQQQQDTRPPVLQPDSLSGQLGYHSLICTGWRWIGRRCHQHHQPHVSIWWVLPCRRSLQTSYYILAKLAPQFILESPEKLILMQLCSWFYSLIIE